MQQAQRACDRCYRIRVRCVPQAEGEPCERCQRLSHECRTDRAVLQPGRPSKRHTLAHRTTAVSSDDAAVEVSSPEDSSLSLVQTADPLTRAVHGFQQKEIRRLEYFFDHEHLDTFVGKVLYGPSFRHVMKTRLVSQFLQHPATLKDAFLACEAAVAVRSPKAGDSDDKLQVMRRTSNAVSSLQWANPTRIEDVAAVLSLALIIITVNDLVIGQPTRAILRSALILAQPWSEQVAQPSSPWFDFNIICLLFAEMHECLLHAEVPVFRFEYNGTDTYVDRYYGICYRLLPILYDICVLASSLRRGQHPDSGSDLLISQLLTQLDTWPAEPTIEDIEEHNITAQELRHIVRQAWCYKAMAKIVLCYLTPTSRARTLVGQVLSEDIRNEISTGRKYSSGGGQYLLFPYFVACFDLEDITEQQDVLNQMESITEGMAPKACESMCRFLRHIWSVRLLHHNPSWQTMRDQSPTIALGP